MSVLVKRNEKVETAEIFSPPSWPTKRAWLDNESRPETNQRANNDERQGNIGDSGSSSSSSHNSGGG